MQPILRRRDVCQFILRWGGMVGVVLAASCSGGSYISSGGTPAAAPTNVVGKSNTSGISAGAALQAPKGTSTPKP